MDKGRARDLLCYWTVVEPGMPMVDLASKFDITPAAVSYAVQRGEKLAQELGNGKLQFFEYLRSYFSRNECGYSQRSSEKNE